MTSMQEIFNLVLARLAGLANLLRIAYGQTNTNQIKPMKIYSAFNFLMQCLEKVCCILFACVAIAGFACFGIYLVLELFATWNQ